MTKIRQILPKRDDELKNPSYEVFMLFLAILSIVNLFLEWVVQIQAIEGVLIVMDVVLSLIFLADFTYRLFTAESKRKYFITQFGWLDLLSSLPLPRIKLLRLVRIFRAIRLLRVYGLRNIIREFILDRAGSALWSMLLLVILIVQFGSIAVLYAEQGASNANIVTAGDAIWWSFVTISTVGYGDYYPVTGAGRSIATLVIVVGVGLFGVITGFLANAFLGDGGEADDNEAAALAAIQQTLTEIRQAQQEQDRETEQIKKQLGYVEDYMTRRASK